MIKKNSLNQEVKKKIENSIWGFILGDCWGVPYEFKRPSEIKFKKFNGFGTHYQPAGTWSDDTALMLCHLSSYDQGYYSMEKEKDNLRRFLNGEYSINNLLFDVGYSTKRSILDTDCDKSEFYGNGGLLRCWIMATSISEGIYNKKNLINSLSLTHSNSELHIEACEMYFSLLTALWKNDKWTDQQLSDYKKWKQRAEIQRLDKDGTIFNAVIISIDAFFQNKGIEDVIKLGGDTDSNAALYGAIYYANKPFPEKYKQKILGRDIIEQHLDILYQI